MKDFLDQWDHIRNNRVDYTTPSDSYSDCNIYITENYVFKQSNKNSLDLYKSKNIINYLYNKNINVPKVMFCSKSNNLVVYERINGTIIKNINDPYFAYNTGNQLSNIHSIEFNDFGNINFSENSKITGEFNNINNYIKYTVNKSDQFIPKDSIFRDIFVELRDILNKMNVKNIKSHICHLDYDYKNIICENKNCYIIDFMESELSLKSMDVVSFYLYMKMLDKSDEFVSEFIRGYGKKLDDFNDFNIIVSLIKNIARKYFCKNNKKCDKSIEERYKIVNKFACNYISTYNL